MAAQIATASPLCLTLVPGASGMSGLFGPLTLPGVLSALRHMLSPRQDGDGGGEKGGADGGGGPASSYPPPSIPINSKHYVYAMLTLAGELPEVACKMVDISPRTAERYRSELREAGRLFFGREKTYDFCARYALDREWRRVVDGEFGEREAAPAPGSPAAGSPAAGSPDIGNIRTAPNRPRP